MPAPIEYGVQIADPTQAFLSAFQAGTSIQDARFKQEQQVQQAAQQKLIQEGFTKLRGPNATAADYANLSMMLPETQAKAVRESFGMLSGERQQVALREAGEVFSAFKSGKPEIAITRLDRQIEGKRNAGDEAGAKFLETWRDVAKQDPMAAEVYFGSTISQIPGGDKIIESAIKLSAESRAAAKAPSELLKAKGEADKAVADASAAVADAKKKVAEAEDTPSRLLAEADLRAAQTAQQRALTAASEGEEARAAEKAPSELKRSVADADKAVSDADKALSDAITAQETARNAPEKAVADAAKSTAYALKAKADAQKAEVDAEFARAKAVLEIKQQAATLRKTDADILIDKENARIAALNAAQAKETNVLRRQELQQKIDDATKTRDATDRDQKATLASQVSDIDNFLNTATRVVNTPKDIIKSATGPVTSRLLTFSADVSDFEGLVETLGSQAFITQIPKIKGVGALSEREGDKLQASLQNLSLKQSPERLVENVKESVRLLTKARANITAKSGLPTIPFEVRLPNGQTATFPTQAAVDAFKKQAGIQ